MRGWEAATDPLIPSFVFFFLIFSSLLSSPGQSPDSLSLFGVFSWNFGGV